MHADEKVIYLKLVDDYEMLIFHRLQNFVQNLVFRYRYNSKTKVKVEVEAIIYKVEDENSRSDFYE